MSATDPAMTARVAALESALARLEALLGGSTSIIEGLDFPEGLRIPAGQGIILAPGPAPDVAEGILYYDADADAVKLRGAASWETIITDASEHDPLEFTPLDTLATSGSWNGDSKSGNATIDLSAAFGLPAGIKAVAASVSAYHASTGRSFALGRNSSNKTAIQARTQVANIVSDVAGVVPCDSNGDIYFSLSAALSGVWIYISGYWL